jgi:prophage antirepressor-like protein
MNEITLFENHELNTQIRTLNIENESWFVAKDVANALEISNLNTSLENFPEDEKLVVTSKDFDTRYYLVSKFSELFGSKSRRATLLNEPGLYRLIFQSRKKEAESFKRWVFHEVLPSIRKQGFYLTPQVKRTISKETIKELYDSSAELKQKIIELNIKLRSEKINQLKSENKYDQLLLEHNGTKEKIEQLLKDNELKDFMLCRWYKTRGVNRSGTDEITLVVSPFEVMRKRQGYASRQHFLEDLINAKVIRKSSIKGPDRIIPLKEYEDCFHFDFWYFAVQRKKDDSYMSIGAPVTYFIDTPEKILKINKALQKLNKTNI